MYTHKRDIDYALSSGALETTRSRSAEAKHEISIDIPPNVGDWGPIAFALDITQLKAFFMVVDGDLEVYTNNVGPGIDLFSLKANEPVHYMAGGDPAESNPFTADVTMLYVDNASPTATVHLDIRALIDPVV